MTPETLEAKITQAQKAFDEKSIQKENLEKQVLELDQELYRLQGEYRGYKSLQANTEATTITATPEAEIIEPKEK